MARKVNRVRPRPDGVLQVALTQGQVALVDPQDWEQLQSVKWYARWDEKMNSFYVVGNTSCPTTKKRKTLYMTRQILNARPGLEVDHRNHQTLDNRRCNLRLATPSQNGANRGRLDKRNTTGFHGVTPCRVRYRAVIKHNGKFYHLGVFDTPEEAALAYDAAATEMHGEFATLNEV